jgi:hypothetical protein
MLFYTKIGYALAIIFVKIGIYLWCISSSFCIIGNAELAARRGHYFHDIHDRLFYGRRYYPYRKSMLPGRLDHPQKTFPCAPVVKPF